MLSGRIGFLTEETAECNLFNQLIIYIPDTDILTIYGIYQ